ncbi:MAG: phage portal protein [Phycisphaerae bacterium]|nr:phage portal protein [Phycisphaerae bacterium]
MSFQLANFADPALDGDYLTYLVDQRWADVAERCQRLWDYFRNPLIPAIGPVAESLNASSRPYVQAQEMGLPPRITGRPGAQHLTDLRRKEVVIENDIAWRLHTAIDFLFGKPPVIRSLSADPRMAAAVERVIEALLEANGGVGLLQEMALFGAVYGFVDIALRTPADGPADFSPASLHPAGQPADGSPLPPKAGRPGTPDTSPSSVEPPPSAAPSDRQLARAVAAAAGIQLETLEATRILPILHEDDYRRLRYWIQRYPKHPARMESVRRGWFGLGPVRSGEPAAVEVIEILGPVWWQRYEDRELVAEGPNVLGRLPIVHIQNTALPGSYDGLGDVEPLIALQDELNTRLSDRANRVTYQSFKMYLGKGIDDFLERPVGPGQMWSTANLQASIEEFGSDTGSPSEDAHIEQVRQALDKVSAVSPLAAGLIRGNVGYLTSASALKVLLSGLLARTARKRLTYGTGIARIVELALGYLDTVGVLRTSADDRRIEIHWPSPLPDDEAESLRNAQTKATLGVPAETVLAELGYGPGEQNSDLQTGKD